MKRMTRTGAAAAVVGAAAVVAAGLVFVRTPALTPEGQGAALAGRLGCFNCHGPAGTGGIPNPGAEEGEVPGWTGGALAMYAKDDAEVREWITNGITRRQKAADAAEPPAHDLIRMPAFGRRASAREIGFLAAYVEAVAGWPRGGELRSSAAARGMKVASRLACFGCHGPGGLTGAPNPGSLTGEIPAWAGRDFGMLVRDDAELKSWILDGGIPRFESNPLARFFIDRAAIHMPAYRGRVAGKDLSDLVAYIGSLQRSR